MHGLRRLTQAQTFFGAHRRSLSHHSVEDHQKGQVDGCEETAGLFEVSNLNS